MTTLDPGTRVTVVCDFTANALEPATVTGTLTAEWSPEDDALELRKGRRDIIIPAHRVVYVEAHSAPDDEGDTDFLDTGQGFYA